MTEKELMNEAYEWRKHIKNLVTATDDELYHKRSKVFDWLIEQAEKVERYEKVLKQIARHELFTESYFCDLEANELIYKAQEVLEGEE